MALGFLFMWACGYVMTSVIPKDWPLQDFLFGLHISVGVTLIFLLALRVIVRIRKSAPSALEALSNWEKSASHLGHLALYAMPAFIILIGWAETDFGGHGVTWFGISMPKIFPTMETFWGYNLETVTANIHKWVAYIMLAVVVVHIAAVIKHRMEGHDVLTRMAFK